MIQEYHFGSITIDNKTYDYDVEVRWVSGQKPCEVLKWWRKESHVIDAKDVNRAMEQRPDITIIGTGESGVARVTEKAKEAIKSAGAELIIGVTGEAIKNFNIVRESIIEEEEQKKVIGLFHLTC